MFINSGFVSISVYHCGSIVVPKVIYKNYTVIYDPIKDFNYKVSNVKSVSYYNNNLCFSFNKNTYVMMRKGAVFLTADSFQELVREYKILNL